MCRSQPGVGSGGEHVPICRRIYKPEDTLEYHFSGTVYLFFFFRGTGSFTDPELAK